MFNFFHSIAGKIAIGISTALISIAGFISPSPKTEPVQIPVATSTIEAAIATSTKKEAPETTKAVEAPAPKKVTPASVPATVTTPAQPSAVSADSQLVAIEKCKAKRDISMGAMWPAILDVLKVTEQAKQKSTLDMLVAAFPSGSISGSTYGALAKMAKISDAEHEKNLQTAEAMMDAQLAKEYAACLSGN